MAPALFVRHAICVSKKKNPNILERLALSVIHLAKLLGISKKKTGKLAKYMAIGLAAFVLGPLCPERDMPTLRVQITCEISITLALKQANIIAN